jgi:hypothetical protein
MKAFDIFTAAIKYLKEQMLAQLQRSLKGTTIEHVHFVLTVPAISIYIHMTADKYWFFSINHKHFVICF